MHVPIAPDKLLDSNKNFQRVAAAGSPFTTTIDWPRRMSGMLETRLKLMAATTGLSLMTMRTTMTYWEDSDKTALRRPRHHFNCVQLTGWAPKEHSGPRPPYLYLPLHRMIPSCQMRHIYVKLRPPFGVLSICLQNSNQYLSSLSSRRVISRISTGTDVGGKKPNSVMTRVTYLMGVKS